MELLSVIAAKSTWLFDMQDLNPRGKQIYPDIIDWLKENYNFSKVPKSLTDLDPVTKGLVFEGGNFQAKDEFFIAVTLTLYNDGIFANSQSSTKDTDAFINDVLTTAAKDFNLVYKPEMIRRKIYISELTVRIDYPLGNLNPKLNAFAAKISSTLNQADVPPFEMNGLNFWNDHFATVVKQAPFSIDRRLGAPFSENRYFSRSPLQTDDHLSLLEEFEQLLAP